MRYLPSFPTAMHSDPSKKASIDSLLNPQHDSPYSLRAAFSWETSSKHVADLPPWPTHYDDRHHPSPDRDPYAPPQSHQQPTAWQSTERASVRLAARGTMSENPSSQHDARYSTPVPSADYPQPHLNHSQYRFQSQYALQLNQTLPSPQIHSLGPTSLQQPQESASSSSQPQPDTDSEPEGSNSASRKRSRPVSEGQAAEPQSKRAKGKSKPPADAATGTRLDFFSQINAHFIQDPPNAAINEARPPNSKVRISLSRSTPSPARHSRNRGSRSFV